MSQEDTTTMPRLRLPVETFELAALLQTQWDDQLAALRASGVPLCADGDGGSGDGSATGDGTGDGGDGANGSGDGGDGTQTFDREYVQKLRQENAAARKRAQEAEAKAKKFEEQNLTETEKLKQAAEEGSKLGESGTRKLREANLIVALSDKGLTGGRAKAAAKLLDRVEFDDDDEPKNLDAALKAASAQYGEDLFAAESRSTSFDGGARRSAPKVTDMDAAIRQAAGRS